MVYTSHDIGIIPMTSGKALLFFIRNVDNPFVELDVHKDPSVL
jgi:hypothetical protein